MYTCARCRLRLESADELEFHLANEHVRYLAYECEQCQFAKFPTEFTLRNHYKAIHGLDEFYVRYKSSPYDDRLRREFVDLYNLSMFGTKNIRAAMLAIGIEPRNEDDDDEEERTPITTAAIEVLHECKKEVDIDDFDDEEDEQEIADDDDDDDELSDIIDHGHRTRASINLRKNASFAGFSSKYSKNVNTPTIIQPSTSNIEYHNRRQTIQPHLSSTNNYNSKTKLAMRNLRQQLMKNVHNRRKPSDPIDPTLMSSRGRALVRCALCDQRVRDNGTCKLHHVSKNHNDQYAFECRACVPRKGWLSWSDKKMLIKHVSQYHAGDRRLMADNRANIADHIRALVRTCFE